MKSAVLIGFAAMLALPALGMVAIGLSSLKRQEVVVDRKSRSVRRPKAKAAIPVRFDELVCVKLEKQAGLRASTATVTLEPTNGRAIFLGHGPLQKAEALARRLSELTGAKIERSAPPSLH